VLWRVLRPPRPPLFPYTTLFRSLANGIGSAASGASEVAAHSAAAAITADIRDRADPALVRADRVEQLYSQLPLGMAATVVIGVRSEEHTSELQSLAYLVCRLLLE